MLRNFAGLVLFAAIVMGCGGGVSDAPKVVPAAGVLKYKGQPLADANVAFYPEKGPAGVGKTDTKGAFQIKTNGQLGALVGKHKVTVNVGGPANAEPPPADGNEIVLLEKSTIPKKYSNQNDTDLVIDLPAAGNKELVLDLTD